MKYESIFFISFKTWWSYLLEFFFISNNFCMIWDYILSANGIPTDFCIIFLNFLLKYSTSKNTVLIKIFFEDIDLRRW